MCRALGYVGPPLSLAALLMLPDNGLITQTIDPQYLHMLNLAGFGMMSWNRHDAVPADPLRYKSTRVPFYDSNLASLAGKLSTTCLLAHVRGLAYRPDAGFGDSNLHPFRYPGARLALAHNGDLSGFSRMKPALYSRLKPGVAARIQGTTDSEWVYALLLSQLEDPSADLGGDAIVTALDRTLRILRELRAAHGIDTSSSLNLFLTDGRRQLAVRFTFDFGRYKLDPARLHEANARYLSLWYTAGSHFAQGPSGWRMRGGDGPISAALLASEPLTRDTTGWVEVPEYSAVVVEPGGAGLALRTLGLDA